MDKKKRKAYREYCQEPYEFLIRMWKACKTARQSFTQHPYLPLLKRSDNILADDPKEKVKMLKETFFPRSPNARLDDIKNYCYPEALKTSPITDQEIITAIVRSGSDKAPGSDGIPNRVLKYMGPLITP